MSTHGQGRRYARNDRRSRGVLGLSVPSVEHLEQAGGPVLSVDQGSQEEVAIRLGLNQANKRQRGQPNLPIINRELSVNLEGSSGSMRERARYIFEYFKSKFLNLANRSMQLHSLQRERAQYIAPPPPPPPQEPTSNEIAVGPSRNQVNKRKRSRTNPPSCDCELYLNLEGSSSSMRDTEQYIAPPPPPPPPKEPNFSCPVCMDPFVEEVTTKCGHIFCKACIMAAIKAQHKCPTCRKKLTNKNLTRIYLPITI